MRRSWSRSWRSTTLILVALVALSCGGADDGEAGSDAETAADTDAEPEPETEPEAEAEPEAAPDPHVSVASSELGEILVDGSGMTLYLFTQDEDGMSVCEDDCAAAWPPLTVEGEPAGGEGVDPSLLGTTERSDGDTQLTYAGRPLYTWAQDQEPGDVTGQGVQDVWFVVAPDGEPIMDDAAASGAEGTARSDGY